MVVTRSREDRKTPKRAPRNKEYWKIKKQVSPTVIQVKKEPSSSSDTSNSDSNQTQDEPRAESITPKEEPRSSEQINVPSPHSNPSVDHFKDSPHTNDPDDTSSSDSEAEVLRRAGQAAQCTSESDKNSLRCTESNDLNSNNNTTTSRELPFRKARHSKGSTVENRTVEEILENESEWSYTDENESSCSYASSASVEKENKFKSLLNQKLSQKRRRNRRLKKKSSIYPSSNSEFEISRCNTSNETPEREMPPRNIRTPEKDREFVPSSNSPSKSTSNSELEINRCDTSNETAEREMPPRNIRTPEKDQELVPSSNSPSKATSDSEIEINRCNTTNETSEPQIPPRNICTPEKDQEFVPTPNSPSKATSESNNPPENSISNDPLTTQSSSVQEETNEGDCDNSLVETTSRKNEKDQEFVPSSNSPSKATSESNNPPENSISNDPLTTQSSSVQEETNEDDCGNSLVETTSSNNEIPVKSFEIRLTRAHYVSPERSSTEKQPKNAKIRNTDASTSDTNKKNAQKENSEKNVVSYDYIEKLLHDLEGTTDQEVEINEKKSPEKRKQRTLVKKSQTRDKSSDSEEEKNPQKTAKIKKFRRIRISQNEDSSDSEVEKSRKEPPLRRKLLTPVKKIQNSNKKDSDTNKEFLNRRKEFHSGKNNRDERKHCDETFDQSDDHVNHLGQRGTDFKSHIVNALKCDICNERFTYRHVLRRHQQLMHEKREDYQCTDCGKTFKRLDYLKNHERITHLNDLFECRYCDKKYKYKHSKDIHEKKHKTEKLFKCPLSSCGKRFSRKDNFTKHKMMHRIKNLRAVERRNYTCDDCDETFDDKSDLKIHVQKHF